MDFVPDHSPTARESSCLGLPRVEDAYEVTLRLLLQSRIAVVDWPQHPGADCSDAYRLSEASQLLSAGSARYAIVP